MIFIHFYSDQHAYFINFSYPRQLKITFLVNFRAVKATSVHLLPRNSPPPLPFGRIPEHKWKIGDIFNDFLLFLPLLLELASIITRFLFLQSLQQLEVFAIDGLYLFLAEGIIEAFIHPLVIRILALSLADCMGDPLQ